MDHIDNCKLNNTISNLRWVSHQENQYNRKLNKNSNSSIKGVFWVESRKKWKAQIQFNY